MWLDKAAAQNYAGAQAALGHLYLHGVDVPKDLGEAMSWLLKAADQGDIDANKDLGVAYYTGKDVKKNLALARDHFRVAAIAGDMWAQVLLYATLTKLDDGVDHSVEAASWERKAADQGSADAQVGLGLFYATGLGVKVDVVEAKRLAEAALKQGNEGGRCLLVLLGFDSDPKEKNSMVVLADAATRIAFLNTDECKKWGFHGDMTVNVRIGPPEAAEK